MRIHYLSLVLFFVVEIYSFETSLGTFRHKRQSGCQTDQFRCKSGECIDSYAVCDGEKNCRDGTDETQTVCSKLNLQCPSFAFRCTYGACIDRNKKCNGKQDCADNSDELLPECNNTQPVFDRTCKDEEFKCKSGQCIDNTLLCDGNRDCDDGSDETITECVIVRCPDFSFQCAYGACIDKNKRCNNVDDCSDGSDEDEELCAGIDKPKPPRPKPTPKPPPPPVQPPPVSRGGCIFPDYPEGGSYVVKVCHENSGACSGGPGSTAPMNTILTFQCDKGYILSQKARNVFCFNGVWDPELPQCLKQCKPLISDSMKLDCFYGGKSVNCDSPITPGTTVRPQCKTSYHITDSSAAFLETVCQSDGTWEKPLFRCVPDCGKTNIQVELLISGGQKTKVGEYPWAAGLYLRVEGIWKHICGGTIISPYIILTAAHCVYIEETEQVTNPKDLKVAVGKYRRSWDAHDTFEQRLNVKQIIPQRAYRGQTNSYEQDIAVLDLEVAIVLSATVLPACVDWFSEQVFHVGMKGTVVGWGLNEHQVPTEVLEMTQLPYYDYDSCRKLSPTEYLRFITYDKFCAGYQNGTGVQTGDSGGGLTFVRNNLHFVYGIVSLKLRDKHSLAAFTNVSEHIEWLNNVARALKPLHSN